MKNQFINVFLPIPEEDSEIVSALLLDFNFTGITQNYDEMVITFHKNDWDNEVREGLLYSLSNFKPDIKISKEEIIDDKNWNEEWEKNVDPIIVDDEIVITPSWREKEFDHRLKLIIDPKMSFGTGHHPTTRLICKLMKKLVQPNSEWIDVGTGTGVLAILAAKLGANVWGFDNYSWSVENSIENIEINKVQNSVEITESDIEKVDLKDANGITANLFLHLVVPYMEKFKNAITKNDGDLLISGIMIYDKDLVLESADKANLILIGSETEDEWIAFHFKVNNGK